MKRALASLALVLAVTTAQGALAAGRRDQWDVARAPDERKSEEAFQTARTILEQATVTRSPLMRHDFAATARSMLEELGAEKSSDPRLRFALGHALHWLDDDARVIAVLRPAVDEFATHPDVHVALFDLAVSYARTNRSRDEILMYDRALELEARPDVRHTILSNRAEAKLKIGLIDEAIEDYRTSIALFPDQPLPRWGLAVAWDRAGNFSEGLAPVGVGAKTGFIDREGRVVVEPLFDTAQSFADGLAPVRVNHKWGYVDRLGRMVIDPTYESAAPFSDGVACVRRFADPKPVVHTGSKKVIINMGKKP